MNFGQHKKTFLYVLVSFLIVAGFLALFLWLMDAMGRASANLKKTKTDVALLEEERKMARLSSGIFEERSKDLARLESFAADRERPVVFVEFLESTAKKTGNLIALDFDEVRSKGNFLFFRLTVDGSEKSTRQYLKLLELAPFELYTEEFIFQRVRRDTAGSKGIGPDNRLILLISVKAP